MPGGDRDDEACRLVESCEFDSCGSDAYLLPGWDGTMAYVKEGGCRMEEYSSLIFGDRDVYLCDGLPYYEALHRPGPILESLEEEIQEKSGGGPVDLLGSSFGGTLAQLEKLRKPEAVDKVALVHAFDCMEPLEGFISKGSAEYIFFNLLRTELGDGVADSVNTQMKRETRKGWKGLFELDVPDGIELHAEDIYALNCSMDSLVGRTPNLPEGSKRVKFKCLHHTVTEEDLRELRRFFEGR